MREQHFAFRCHHPDCAGDPPLEVIVELPTGRMSSTHTKEKLVYCERNHPNIVTLPDAWDERSPVLGDLIIGYDDEGLPLFQGRPQ